MEQEILPAQPLTRKERRALKRTEKQERRNQKQTKRSMARATLWILVFLVIAGAVGFFVFSSKDRTSRPDLSHPVSDEGREHISEGTSVQYVSNPPTSGSHWDDPLADGIYNTEKPDEAVVHSLEHGRVWVSYKPSVPEQTKKSLEELLKRYNGTILTPRSANDTDIALAAWNRLDTFNLNADGTFEEQRIIDFINRWRNKAPEFVPGSGEGKTYE